ncbi:MAG: hypothetical protein WB647_00810 [Roseiarcus sp.]|uniref:hypothetical protein n=1 Tax=Roseiarcus sp. TaxID=1969460 RepID=UPI003C35AE45
MQILTNVAQKQSAIEAYKARPARPGWINLELKRKSGFIIGEKENRRPEGRLS